MSSGVDTGKLVMVDTSRKRTRFDVVGLGTCSVDILCLASGFPKRDSKNWVAGLTQQSGGMVGTALVALARLGAKVSFVGKLGDNELSRFVIREFVRERVDVSGIIKSKEAGPYFAFILVDKETQSRTTWWTDQMVSRIEQGELPQNLISSCQVLHLDDNDVDLAIIAATLAKAKGIRTVLDAESPHKDGLHTLLGLIDYLIVPERFALGFSAARNVGEAGNTLLNEGPKAVVVTQGKGGSLTITTNGAFFQPAFKTAVVDTTGCGDVFHGGFIYGLVRDWPLEATVEFASAVAALKCERLGGQQGCPDWATVRDFLLSKGTEIMKKVIASSQESST